MWFRASRTTMSSRYGTRYSSKYGTLACSGRYRATFSGIVSSAMSVLPDALVLPLGRRPPGDRDVAVLDPRPFGRGESKAVLQEPLVVPVRVVPAGVRSSRLPPLQAGSHHRLRHVEHVVQLQRRQ